MVIHLHVHRADAIVGRLRHRVPGDHRLARIVAPADGNVAGGQRRRRALGQHHGSATESAWPTRQNYRQRADHPQQAKQSEPTLIQPAFHATILPKPAQREMLPRRVVGHTGHIGGNDAVAFQDVQRHSPISSPFILIRPVANPPWGNGSLRRRNPQSSAQTINGQLPEPSPQQASVSNPPLAATGVQRVLAEGQSDALPRKRSPAHPTNAQPRILS